MVQLYVKQPAASVAAPRVRLADFARVHVPAGGAVTVTLQLRPKYRSVVPDGASFWDPHVTLEAGQIDVSIGGGQPDFYPGALHGSITVSGTALLDSC